MNMLDFIIIVILLWTAWGGLRAGLVQTVANLVGWLAGLFIAKQYMHVLAPHLQMISKDPVVQSISAFVLIILGCFVVLWFISSLLESVFKALMLGSVNRLFGLLFGLAKGVLIVLFSIHILSPWVSASPTWQASKMISVMAPFAPAATEKSIDIAKRALTQFKQNPDTSVVPPHEATETN